MGRMVEVTATRTEGSAPCCERASVSRRGARQALRRAPGARRGRPWKSRPASPPGLVGANGAGKTTFIKCALDLCAADAGRVEIFGLDGRQAAARARLAYLPERFVPPHYLLGREFRRDDACTGRRALRSRARRRTGRRTRTGSAGAGAPGAPTFQGHDAETRPGGLLPARARPVRARRADERARPGGPAGGEIGAARGCIAAAARCSSPRTCSSDVEELCSTIAVLEQGTAALSRHAGRTAAALRRRTISSAPS